MYESDRQCRKCQEPFLPKSGRPMNAACRKDGGHHDWFSPFAESLETLQAENTKLQAKLKTVMDYINDLADNGFEKARAVKKEIEGMK